MALVNFRGAIINLYPAMQYNTAIEVSYSFSNPVGEIGDIQLPLPDLAREAIVLGAQAEVLMLPGEGQNMNLGMQKKREYEAKMTELRALGAFGRGPVFWRAPAIAAARPWPVYGGVGQWGGW